MLILPNCQSRHWSPPKNNIFIINGIIHDVMKSKRRKPVLLQIYDYAQMFDSINLKKAINDIFDAGLKDDNLILIYKANEEVNMAVNTPRRLRIMSYKGTPGALCWPPSRWTALGRSARSRGMVTCIRTAYRSAYWVWSMTWSGWLSWLQGSADECPNIC